MSIQRWDPLRDMLTLREAMNSLLEESFVRPRAGMTAMTSGMAMDLKETGDAFVLETVLPGVKPEDVEISILNDALRISAETTEEGEREGETWLMRERRHGRFQRSVTLPSAVRADDANAEFENGILRITLPKSEEQRPKTIQVKPVHELQGARQESGNGQQGQEIPVSGGSSTEESTQPGQ
jgi:HSP20 family protein